MIVIGDDVTNEDLNWYNYFKDKKIPAIVVLNKMDLYDRDVLKDKIKKIKEAFDTNPIPASCKDKKGINTLLNDIARNLPEDFNARTITHNLAKEGDVVLLVMPQDIQAPKGRLILPQVQTIRELLDKK